MEFPTIDKVAKKVAEKALNEIVYEGKTIREWAEIIVKQQLSEDCISRELLLKHLENITMDTNPDHYECKDKWYQANGFNLCKVGIEMYVKNLPSVTPSNDAIREAYIKGYDYGVKDWFKAKTEPCDDCISRKDALKAIEEQKKGFYGVERYAIDECHSAVMKLPSVRTSQSDGKTSQCDNDVTTCDTEKEKETNTEKDSDLNSDSEIHEDKRACENCIHYVTRDSKGVVLCGCDSWECDFEEVKT